MIKTALGDITMFAGDAIVNAGNEEGLGGGGVDGAIHRAAGPALFQECLKLPEARPGVRCPTGEARITGAGRLKCKHVILTAGPIYRDGKHGEPELLANCYRNSLELAAANGLKTVAFPSIATGPTVILRKRRRKSRFARLRRFSRIIRRRRLHSCFSTALEIAST